MLEPVKDGIGKDKIYGRNETLANMFIYYGLSPIVKVPFYSAVNSVVRFYDDNDDIAFFLSLTKWHTIPFRMVNPLLKVNLIRVASILISKDTAIYILSYDDMYYKLRIKDVNKKV